MSGVDSPLPESEFSIAYITTLLCRPSAGSECRGEQGPRLLVSLEDDRPRNGKTQSLTVPDCGCAGYFQDVVLLKRDDNLVILRLQTSSGWRRRTFPHGTNRHEGCWRMCSDIGFDFRWQSSLLQPIPLTRSHRGDTRSAPNRR